MPTTTRTARQHAYVAVAEALLEIKDQDSARRAVLSQSADSLLGADLTIKQFGAAETILDMLAKAEARARQAEKDLADVRTILERRA
jgi:hypothetical protein